MVLGAGLALLLWGCAGGLAPVAPVPAQPPATMTEFKAMAAAPELYQGRQVVLGGEIAGLKQENGKSMLTVDQQELTPKSLYPVDFQTPGGRFWVESDQALSPGVYGGHRKVTVIGVVAGRKEGLLLIKARDLRLWPASYGPVAVPPSYYNYDPNLEYWFTPPYFDPYRNNFP